MNDTSFGFGLNATALDVALECLDNGLSVLPIRPGSKIPSMMKWGHLQKNRMTADEVKRLFVSGCNIAVIGGAVSGNLACIDIDEPTLFQPFLDTLESINPGLRARLTLWQDTCSGGFHIIYRCTSDVGGCVKLAMGPTRVDTLIEIKAGGGYFLIAPSWATPKQSTPEKPLPPAPYTMHGDLDEIPVLTKDEHELCLAVARSFDESGTVESQQQANAGSTPGNRPGDIFNRDQNWHQLLGGYGWTYAKTIFNREIFTRPGKNDGSTSATLNDQGLFCFTTNTPLPHKKPLDKFAVFTWYEHGGDFAAAARALSGGQTKGSAAGDFSHLGDQEGGTTPPPKKERSRCLHIPDELVNPGGLISLGMAALSQPGQVDIPQYNLPVVLSVIGAAIAGKISFMDDVWPNTFAVKIGPTSTGKTSSNKTMSKALIGAGCAELFGPTDIASGPALWRALEGKPRCLLMIDEATSLFRRYGKNDPVADGKRDALLEAYSKSGERIEKAFADKRNLILIESPCLGILGNATPGIFDALSAEDFTSGLIQRIDFWCYEGPTPQRGIATGPNEPLRQFAEGVAALMRSTSGWGNLSGVLTPFCIEASAGVNEIICDWSRQVVEACNETPDDGLKGIVSRQYHLAIKYALIHHGATSEGAFAPMEASSIRYGIGLAKLLSTWKNEVLTGEIRHGDFDRNCEDFKAAIRAVKNKTKCTWAQMVNRRTRLKNLRMRDQMEIADALVARSEIAFEGKDQATRVYRLV